jgi:hypothetical protein
MALNVMQNAVNEVVPRAGVEPARPYGQRILSPFESASPSLTKRYEPVFIGLAVVKVSVRLRLTLKTLSIMRCSSTSRRQVKDAAGGCRYGVRQLSG